MNKTALLVGATGLVGSHCLNELITNDAFSTVHILVRRPLEVKLPEKIQQHLVDFDHIDEFQLDESIDTVFCCLGTTMKKAGSKAAFEKVDYTYVIESAKMGLRYKAKQFLVVSAIGADADSRFFYNQVKGKVEKDLAQLAYDALHIFRPSMLGGKRNEFRLGEQVGIVLMRLFSPFFIGKLKRYAIISGKKVAQAMVQQALTEKQGVFIVESEEI